MRQNIFQLFWGKMILLKVILHQIEKKFPISKLIVKDRKSRNIYNVIK